MRILHVVPSLGSGGSERSLYESLARFPPDIDSRVLVFGRREGGVHDLVERLGVPVVVCPGSYLARLRATIAQIRRWRPDLVHTSVPEADLVGRVAGRLCRVPVLSTLVNTSYDPLRRADPAVGRLALAGHRRLDQLTSRMCVGHFRAVSEAVAADAASGLGIPRRRITVIPRGRSGEALTTISPDERAAVRRELGLPPDAVVVGTVGRMVYQKALDVLLEGFADAVRAAPEIDLRLVHAGPEGPETPRIRARITELGLNGRVVLLGSRPEAAATVLPALDVFAFPSRYEGMPGALIEALGRGLPVVASDIGPNREVADGVARFVPVNDARALGRAILELARDRDAAATLGATGHQRVAVGFDMNHVVEREAALYRSAAGAEPDSPETDDLRSGITRRRVTLVISSTDRRGAETFTSELADELAGAGFEVAFVALEPGRREHPLPAMVLGPSRWSWRTWRELYRHVAPGGVTVAVGGNALIPCAVLGFVRRRAVVYGGIGDPAAWGSVRLATIRVGWPLRACRRVYAIYPGAAEYLVERYRLRADRVGVITNGRSAERFQPASPEVRVAARATLGLDDDHRWVGFVGALSEEKRPLLAIEAVAADKSLGLVVAGDGPLRAQCEQLADRTAAGRVRFLGQVDDARAVYRAVDALVVPSRTEGVPGVAIEAGLSGLPVVATRVGGVPYVVVDGETGLLVVAGDRPGLTGALLGAIGRRDELGAAARRRCVECFSSATIMRGWIEEVSRLA